MADAKMESALMLAASVKRPRIVSTVVNTVKMQRKRA